MAFFGLRAAIAAVAVAGVGCAKSAPAAPPAPPPAVVEAAKPAPEPDPVPGEDAIRIGVIISETGTDAPFGRETRRGVELGFVTANRAGKPHVVAVFADDASDPQHAAAAARSLVDQQHVAAIIGPIVSSRARAAGQAANAKKVALLTPAATNPEVVRVGPYVFRACYDDDAQGRIAAAFLVQRLHEKRIAVLRAENDAYSTRLANAFRAEVQKLGGTIVATATMSKEASDATGPMQQISKAQPDAVFAPLYSPMMPPVARAAKTAGLPATALVGGDAWDARELLADAGDLEGASFVNAWMAEAPSPRTSAFVGAFRGRFASEPTIVGALGYEAATLLAAAVRRAKDGSPASVRDALADTHDFDGLLGPVTFDKNRVTHRPAVVEQIKGGRFVHRETVAAAP